MKKKSKDPRRLVGAIPADLRERSPLITQKSLGLLKRMLEHPDAPRFNYLGGDRLVRPDLGALDRYRRALQTRRGARAPGPPPPEIRARVAKLRDKVPSFRARIPKGLDLARDWSEIIPSSRIDLATAPWEFVPDDEALDRLVIYRTAGTTGHPISVPHHPLSVGLYIPLIEFALERHGAKPRIAPDDVACLLVGAQIRTYTYATVMSAWGGAGFAKVNIRPSDWPRPDSAGRYFEHLAPKILTGDPISFSEMMRMGLPAAPAALVTTSVALSPALKKKLARKYRAPVVDWYSLVETGPIGYGCPKGFGYHQLPHDIHLEALDAGGRPVGPGQRGEIAVTGGRNAFAPLLRYRTGDWGRIDYAACPCGDPMPRLLDLEGRTPVLFRSEDGTPVSTVDISRLLREFPLLLHEFVQRADRSCELLVRPLPDERAPDAAAIEAALKRLLGSVPLKVGVDPTLGDRTDGKARPYRSELMLEE